MVVQLLVPEAAPRLDLEGAWMDRRTYLTLLRYARTHSRREADAEDLLQTALVAALEAKRGDMDRGDNRRWLAGVLRRRALHEARTAARRRRREHDYHVAREAGRVAAAPHEHPALALPPALRTTALLALTGHTRPEIAWLLDLSDATLRKRISDIGRRLKADGHEVEGLTGLKGDLAFGLIRQALMRRVREPGAMLGSHDPDGNLFVVTSRIAQARQLKASDI